MNNVPFGNVTSTNISAKTNKNRYYSIKGCHIENVS